MKKKFLIFLIPVIIASVLFVVVYRHYNKEDKTTTLTINEKRWVEKNKDKTYDFEVVNDYPLYGLAGEGVIFKFLDDFEKNVGIEFNRIPYLKSSTPTTDSFRIEILDNDAKLKDKNLFLFNDNYIVVGKEYERINSTKDMRNRIFGVFEDDAEEISYYLKGGNNLSYKTYKDITELYKALDNDEVNMIVVPNIMYLDYTIEKDKYYINYYLTEMKKQIVLTLSDNNKEFVVIAYFFIGIFLAMIGYFTYFQVVRSEQFINNPYNTRLDSFAERIIRGDIVRPPNVHFSIRTIIEQSGQKNRESGLVMRMGDTNTRVKRRLSG